MAEDSEVHYPLTSGQIRAKRMARDKQRITAQANRLSWERDEITAEYRRASEVYARHLERLNKRMQHNLAEWQSLQDCASQLVDGS